MGLAGQSELLRLSQTVLQATSAIVRHLQETNQEEPSFHQNSPVIQNDDTIEATRILLNDAAHSLLRLVNGPVNEFRSFFMTQYDLAAYQVALEFELFRNVPLNGKINLSELAQKAGIDKDRCGRVVKHLATQHVFNEIQSDIFEHSATSALIARDPSIEALLLSQVDEMFRAASESSTCVQNTPFESDSVNSPFATRFGKPAYLWYAENPEKGVRFARGMAGVAQMDSPISTLRDDFPWASLETSGKVVDIGGGSGHVSLHLASQFPGLNFVVQDSSSKMLADGQARLTPDVVERVSFMQHDFFSEQPITDASAFFIRQCLHNWNDEDCVKIIRALVPALEKCKPGTPLLINDEILPMLNQKTKFEEHLLRQYDMCMFVVFGSKQRTEKEFEKLLKRADPRFKVVKVHGTNSMGLVEAHLSHEL
ncbi:S-adenosyl-L-methionine-dependent methyltransferase [Lojkania enalia]|uniref:S-adenosyl-L-methionine-dependent methyltransferase n=1 Tax=Lojkania enalia TaxID=147567 RepID=A0A9P4MZE7_9PLEO|nr:S-adenosyl-L-methionine-dependent methyltransferase [Didymosphaeria enalia]